MSIGVVGAGTMGSGIAQLAATAGHDVLLVDVNDTVLQKAQASVQKALNRLAEKGQISNAEAIAIFGRIYFSNELKILKDAHWVIEAIVEDLKIKSELFNELEKLVVDSCILASNTSSLSINALASTCRIPSRVIGLHFFNPVALMPLVEHIPALQTDKEVLDTTLEYIQQWGKLSVIAKDTPGFIVNRIARPYYSEALRIYEEGIADFATIDYAMTSIHNFKMGPFALMDFIGNDVNFAVTKSVWEACFFEPRYKPSFTQRNLVSAKWLGKKTGRGYYNYANDLPMPDQENRILLSGIANRILYMLINEAVDAWYYGLASYEDIERAMTKGVNYPMGLLHWAKELGINHCLIGMEELHQYYKEDRYRPSPGFKKLIADLHV
ncbi:MAG: 3-hydroxybutyryl-CoA dehydrogenase [Saprospiraceae bacterium]|nr:3-hydroxybutyryl-CoA dehydrogenase [Saprospiraceae bacterium]